MPIEATKLLMYLIGRLMFSIFWIRDVGFLWYLPSVSSLMFSTSLISLMPSPKSVVRS